MAVDPEAVCVQHRPLSRLYPPVRGLLLDTERPPAFVTHARPPGIVSARGSESASFAYGYAPVASLTSSRYQTFAYLIIRAVLPSCKLLHREKGPPREAPCSYRRASAVAELPLGYTPALDDSVTSAASCRRLSTLALHSRHHYRPPRFVVAQFAAPLRACPDLFPPTHPPTAPPSRRPDRGIPARCPSALRYAVIDRSRPE